MNKAREIQKKFIEISDKINNINKVIENILPQTVIRQTTSFGNSSHVVLSKEFLDKKVGVVILENFIEIPSNSVTLQSGISNRHSRTKGDTINWNVYNKKQKGGE